MSPDLLRAHELLRLRRAEAAGQAVLRHLANQPDDPAGHALLALTRLALEDGPGATAAATHAVALAPDDAHVHFVLGMVQLHGDDAAAAQRSANHALQHDSDHAPSHALLARAHLMRGEHTAAQPAIEAALRLEPHDSEHHLLHAAALQAAGDRRGALAAVHTGLALAPDDADLHSLHGELLLADGAPGPAGEAFLAALRGDPNDDRARRGLLEALRARHPAYRPALLLRTGTLQLLRRGGLRVLLLCYVSFLGAAVLIWGSVGQHAARAALFAAFVLPTELGNACLLLHPLGRHVLRRREKVFAVVTCVLLLTAVGFAAACWVGDLPALRRAALSCAGAALFAALLHFAVEHSRMRRTTWVLIGILVAMVATMLAANAFV